MTDLNLIYTLYSAFGLLLIWTLLYLGVRECRVDATRQHLFSLRDELFDYAADGGIGFDDPAYGRLRLLINSLIRFNHKLTFSQLVVSNAAAALCAPELSTRPHGKLMDAIAAMPSEEAQRKLRDIHDRVNFRVVLHITLGSPLMLIYLLVHALSEITRTGLRRFVLPPVDRLEDEAVLAEELEREQIELAHA